MDIKEYLKSLSVEDYKAIISKLAKSKGVADLVAFAKEKNIVVSQEMAEKVWAKLQEKGTLDDLLK